MEERTYPYDAGYLGQLTVLELKQKMREHNFYVAHTYKKADLIEILSGKKSPGKFHSNCPITIIDQSYSFLLRVRSSKGAKEPSLLASGG